MVRQVRQRDEDAVAIADQTIADLAVGDAERAVVRLAVIRGVKGGKAVMEPRLADLEGQVAALSDEVVDLSLRLQDAQAKLADAQRRLQGNGLKYASHLGPAVMLKMITYHRYGMTLDQLCRLYHCERNEVEEVLKAGGERLTKAKTKKRQP